MDSSNAPALTPADALTTLELSLGDEAESFRWLQTAIQSGEQVPLLEAEAVVRSLSVAMHGHRRVVLPLLQLKEFDQYTTTHSLNVSVLSMALAEAVGMRAAKVITCAWVSLNSASVSAIVLLWRAATSVSLKPNGPRAPIFSR